MLVRQATAACKQKEKGGSLTSATEAVTKGASKRKNEGKDYCPQKKGMGTPIGNKQLK